MNLTDHILINPRGALAIPRTGDAVYLSKEYLVHLGIKEHALTVAFGRYTKGSIKTFANIRVNGKRYVDYDSINWPDIKPFKNGSAYPDKLTLIDQVTKERKQLVEEAKSDMFESLPSLWNEYYQQADERWYRQEKRVNNGRCGDQSKSEDLATGMAILRFLYTNSNLATIKFTTNGTYTSKKELQTAVGAYLRQMNPRLQGFPTNYDSIRKLTNKYKKAVESGDDPRELLLHGNTGNDHNLKLDEAQELVIQELYLQPRKPDFYAVYRDYFNWCIRHLGKKENELVSYTRVKQYCTTPEMQLISSKVRDGSAYYDSVFRPFVLRKSPEYSMSLISGDGWEPGRSARFNWFNPKTRKWQMRTGTMNVWYWYDWKSKYILSHRVSGFENGQQIRLSFRDIIAMYDGRVPRSVMIDLKWQNNPEISSMMDKAGVMYQEKQAYAPKTNRIERNNKEMNKLHRQFDEYWANMDRKTNSVRHQHNDEHLRGVDPLTEQELNEMVMTLIQTHNNTMYKSLGGKTPRQVFFESISPDCRVVDALEQTWLFGERTIVRVKNYTVSVTVSTITYTYVIPNESRIDLTRQIGKDWRVKVYYDERHMDQVDIYVYEREDSDITDRYICTAINSDKVRVNSSSVEAGDDKDHSRNLAYQKAGVNVVDKYIQDLEESRVQRAGKLDINLASVRAMSQEKFKEAMSDEVARQYKSYYEDQLDTSYDMDSEQDSVLDEVDTVSKMKQLEKSIGDKYQE